ANHADLPRSAERRGDHPAHPLRRVHEAAHRERRDGSRQSRRPTGGIAAIPQRRCEMTAPSDFPAQSTDFREPIEEAPEPYEHYLNHKYGLASWLLTQDHKRIAI